MPTITINKESFLKLVGRKLSDAELYDRISMLGTSVENVTAKEIVVEVFPNRPDLLSEQGLARAVATFIGVRKGLIQYKVEKSAGKVTVEASVKNVRPFTACAIVRALQLDDEKIRQLMQVQEKLHVTFGRQRKKVAIGVYPLEKIAMPIKYGARKPSEIHFQPLGAKKVMSAKEILEVHPAGKEYAQLLKDAVVYPVFVDAKGNILSMPPIINSELTGRVAESTREVFVECSGHDLDVVQQCLNMVVTVLADMGGRVFSMEIVYGSKKIRTPDLTPRQISLHLSYVAKRLGVALPENEAKRCVERMGYGYKGGKVLIPAYRTDVLHEVDIVEDIAIALGYDNLHAEIPKVATVAAESPFEVFRNKVCEILVGFGLQEVNTYTISSKEELNAKMNTTTECVELANALTADYNVLRSWITPSLMRVLSENTHHEYPQQLFSSGLVFQKDAAADTGVKEQVRLAVALCSRDVNFTSIKQILDGICHALAIQSVMKETKHGSFIEGRVGRVSVQGKEIAYVGEVHPHVLEKWNVQMPVAALELNLTELFSLLRKENKNI